MDNYLEMRRHIFPNAHVTSPQQYCSSSVSPKLVHKIAGDYRGVSHESLLASKFTTRSNLGKKYNFDNNIILCQNIIVLSGRGQVQPGIKDACSATL